MTRALGVLFPVVTVLLGELTLLGFLEWREHRRFSAQIHAIWEPFLQQLEADRTAIELQWARDAAGLDENGVPWWIQYADYFADRAGWPAERVRAYDGPANWVQVIR